MNRQSKQILVLTTIACFLSACASSDKSEQRSETSFSVASSYLNDEHAQNDSVEKSNSRINTSRDDGLLNNDERVSSNPNSNFVSLKPLQNGGQTYFSQKVLSERFSEIPSLNLAIENMPMRDFLHRVFNDLLNVNYVIDDALKSNQSPVTLSIIEKISQKRLFELTSQLLAERGAQISFNENVYLLHGNRQGAGQNIIAAIGKQLTSVPNTSQQILQVVPLAYGINLSLERTLRQITDVEVIADFEQNALFLKGTRQQILRALDFVQLLDNPANRGSHIGLINLTFLNVDTFSEKMVQLMQAEGVPISSKDANGKNVVLVALEQIGSIAVFATSETLLSRVEYWASVLDKPSQGATEQYFTYRPEFARASDIGDSLSRLLGGFSSAQSGVASNNQSSTQQQRSSDGNTGNAPDASRNSGVSKDGFKMVVDERTNTLIFLTSGSQYQQVLPLVKELDVLPKQVMLDITIAEVTLTDQFKYGVEWALTNSDVTLSTQDAFGVNSIGGLALDIIGKKGPVNAAFEASDDLVEILSNPTLLVRDGMSATIDVGSRISVVGATVSDPINGERQETQTEYVETGVDITVTPTVNAKGIVIMEIRQSISNTVPDSSGAGGNPNIFERSLTTEVVANSGQTILLGGLISEDVSNGNTNVPGLSKVPLIGKLFQSEGDRKTRTELVMMITPRVLEDEREWQKMGDKFKEGLRYIKLD
jgi:general secretion pathway protein D